LAESALAQAGGTRAATQSLERRLAPRSANTGPVVVDAARRLAEDLLFPAANEIDAAPIVPRGYLDELAAAGLYDLPADPVEAGRVVEALGGASLVTAFVWIQHHSPVRAIAAVGGALAERFLGPMRSGRVRAGIAYAALRRPGPPAAIAVPLEETSGDWLLSGCAPWVTGWGLIDVALAGARCGNDMVWLLIDASAPASSGMSAEPVALAALQASATVRLEWAGFVVPAERVVAVEPYEDWRRRDAGGRAANGYLALGVAGRCAQLLGSSRLTSSVEAARAALDASTPATVAGARSEASLLAVRAAAAVVAAGGGRSMESGATAARLMREATFLLVFGQTPDIRATQIAGLGA
jgi:hypothetical protein